MNRHRNDFVNWVIVFPPYYLTVYSIVLLMGVYSPVNMIFLCGFVFALILIFVLTTTVSRLAVRVRKLTQMVGILNKKLDSIEKNELK